MNVVNGTAQSLQTGNAQRFVECQVGFVCADKVGGGIDYGPVEFESVIDRHPRGIHIQAHADKAPVVLAGLLKAGEEWFH